MNTNVQEHSTTRIEQDVRSLLTTMGFEDSSVTCDMPAENMLHIAIDAGDYGRMLIGSQGAHLAALQHIARCLLRRKLNDNVYISVDVNGYRARRERSLFGLAEEVARKAQNTGRTVALRPMSAADRRTIHTALANYKDIRTESLGDEPNRRVVVRPVFL